MSTFVTIVACWVGASYVVGLALVTDQMRRSPAEWEAAGRDRRFWVSLALIAGFHGLGQYAAAAYLTGVRPRFGREARSDDRERPLRRMNAAFSRRWQPAETDVTRRWHIATAARPKTAVEELAVLAAVLVFASSLIHAVVTAVHFEEYWLFGVLFGLTSCLQAAWTALIYSQRRCSRNVLLAGAVGNAALVVAWIVSRTVGLPLGPHAWEPEAVGAVDVLATIDELIAVMLLAGALACLRSRRPSIPRIWLMMASAVAGVLFLYSVLSPFAGDHVH